MPRWNDFADRIFDARENLFAFFESRAGRRVDVKTKLTSVHGWEKVAAHDWQDDECAADEDREQNKDGSAILQRPSERIDVTLPKTLKAFLERLLNPGEYIGRRPFAFMTAEKIFHHHRDQR